MQCSQLETARGGLEGWHTTGGAAPKGRHVSLHGVARKSWLGARGNLLLVNWLRQFAFWFRSWKAILEMHCATSQHKHLSERECRVAVAATVLEIKRKTPCTRCTALSVTADARPTLWGRVRLNRKMAWSSPRWCMSRNKYYVWYYVAGSHRKCGRRRGRNKLSDTDG